MNGKPPLDGGGWQSAMPWPQGQQQAQQHQALHPQFAVQQHFSHFQNPNYHLHFQNPIVNGLLPNPTFLPHFRNSQWQNPPPPPALEKSQQWRPKSKVHSINPDLNKCNRAVVEARRDVLASGEIVSAWKVSQVALVKLKADSWESLGFQMKQLPALQQTMAIEAKINTFIHCFVEVKKITSLYDMELAICENEGIEMFEELELGPLVGHPLVLHYFQVSPDTKEAFRITSEDLITHLQEFLLAHPQKKIQVDKFLDYVAEKHSLACKEKLTVRIQSLGWHISLIRNFRKLEVTNGRKLKEKYEIIRDRPLSSLKRNKLDKCAKNMYQDLNSPSSIAANHCGKHKRFISSSDNDDDDCAGEDDSDDGVATKHKAYQHEKNATRVQSLSSQLRRSDRVTRCPYPSLSKEMTRLGLKHQAGKNTETDIGNDSEDVKSNGNKRKRITESICNRGSISIPRKLIKGDKKATSHKGRSGGPHILSEPGRRLVETILWKRSLTGCVRWCVRK